MQENLNYKIYWEKQGVDSLCGVHCINSLLQGPFFDEIELSNIALELDKKEKQLMGQQGITKDYLKFMKQQSGNVALDGNYSIQVLQQALKKFDLHMISIDTINQKSQLSDKNGYICNSSAHWLAIRKIKGVWYNLNSLGMRLPEIISDFYLSAFLIAVKNSGYQIFSVEGKYPDSNENTFDNYNNHQEWYPAKRVKKYHEKKSKRKGYKPNISGGNDSQMEKAIAMSLGKKYDKYESSGEDSDWQNDKPKPPKPFAGKAVLMGQENFEVLYDKFMYDIEDAELITIMKMTLEQRFKAEPEQGIVVTFRFSDGKKQRRIFAPMDSIENLYDYLWMNRNPKSQFYLVDLISKQKLVDVSIPIGAIAEDNEILLSVTDI